MKKTALCILALLTILVMFTAVVSAANNITLEGAHTVTAGQSITVSVKITNSTGTAIHAIQATTPVLSGAALTIEEVPNYVNRDITTGFLWANRTQYRDGDICMNLKVTPDGSKSSLSLNNSVLNLQAFDNNLQPVRLEDTAFAITVHPMGNHPTLPVGGGGSSGGGGGSNGGGSAPPQPAQSGDPSQPTGTTASAETTAQTPQPSVTAVVPKESPAPEKTASPISGGGILASLGALSAAVVLRRK